MFQKFPPKKLFVLVLLSLFMVALSAHSLEYKVLAVVNGEAISSIQLKDRVDLIIKSSGKGVAGKARSQIAKEAMEILINEKLQEQEAKMRGVLLTEEDISRAVADLEKRNGIAPGGFKGFISAKGLSYEAALEQIKSNMLWKKTIARTSKNPITVSDEEVSERAKVYDKIPVKKLVNLSEIIIPKQFDDETGSEEFAQSIVRTLRAGTETFADMAKKYSVGKTAKNGGQIGWIDENGVMSSLKGLVSATSAGGVSEPTLINELYVIIKVNDRKVFDPKADKEKIKELVFNDKLEKSSKKFIKELRQKSLIEKKYTFTDFGTI